MNPENAPFLGSAMWGEWVGESEVYKILDIFYDSGFRNIDIATNYPINGQDKNFKQAIIWLSNWCLVNQCNDLKIYLKIGSKTNHRTNEIDLTPKFLKQEINKNLDLFSTNLSTIGIHWDKRGASREDIPAISDTLESVYSFNRSNNLNIGFSGIEYPKLYKEALDFFDQKPIFQIKENLLSSKTRENYLKYFPKASFIAYGINLGSVKRELDHEAFNNFINKNILKKISSIKYKIEPSIEIKTLSELSIYFAAYNPNISSYIIAPSSAKQLRSSIEFIKMIEKLNLTNEKKLMRYLKIKKLFRDEAN